MINLKIVSKGIKSYEDKKKDNGPFALRGVAKSMSRQIFTFLGIISQSTLGEDYLDKKNFYNLIRKGLVHSGKFDYIFSYSESVPSMLLGNKTLEITDVVIKEINNEYKSSNIKK